MFQWGTLLNQAGTNNIYSEFTHIQAGDCCSLTASMPWARSIVYTASTFVIKNPVRRKLKKKYGELLKLRFHYNIKIKIYKKTLN